MSVFDITGGDAEFDYNSPFVTDSIKKIAKVTDQDTETMQTQFEDVHPRVIGYAKTSAGKTSKNCWKDVTDMIRQSNKRGCNHPIDVITEGSILHHVFGISSSGVEQHFSKTQFKFNDRRLKAFPESEEYVIRAISDLENHDLDTIIKIAKRVWVSIYGPPRKASWFGRITKGVKRKFIDKRGKCLQPGMVAITEKEFIAKRRQAASASSSSTVPSVGLDYESLVAGGDVTNQDHWSDAHAGELKFQREKLHSRKLQAVAEGVVEGDASLKQQLKDVVCKRIKDQRARERKTARDIIKVDGTTAAKLLTEISGRPSHVLCEKTPHLLAAMRNKAMNEVKPMFADVFIVDLPSEVGERARLVTAMRGSFQVSSSLLTSGGTLGIASKWRAISAFPRVVFVSEAANVQNASAIKLLKCVLENCSDNHIELKVGGTFEELDNLVNTIKPVSKLIAIVRNAEVKLPVSTLVWQTAAQQIVVADAYVRQHLTLICEWAGLAGKRLNIFFLEGSPGGSKGEATSRHLPKLRCRV